MKIWRIFLIVVCLSLAALTVSQSVLAFDVSKTGLQETGAETEFYDISKTDLTSIIGKVIGSVLAFLGVVLVIIIIYGGFLYMTAGGDAEKAKKAKDWIVNAVIGLAIILMAYAITSFVIGQLTESVTGTTTAPPTQ